MSAEVFIGYGKQGINTPDDEIQTLFYWCSGAVMDALRPVLQEGVQSYADVVDDCVILLQNAISMKQESVQHYERILSYGKALDVDTIEQYVEYLEEAEDNKKELEAALIIFNGLMASNKELVLGYSY